MAYRNIYSAVIFFVALFFAGEIGAQTTVHANRVIAKDSVRIAGRWVKLVSTDSTFSAANHTSLPTTKAVYDFVVESAIDTIYVIDGGTDPDTICIRADLCAVLPPGLSAEEVADQIADSLDAIYTAIENIQDSLSNIPDGNGTAGQFAKWQDGNSLVGSALSEAIDRLTVAANLAFRITGGTTASRPTGAAGMMYWNTSNNWWDTHNGTSWFNPLRSATATGLGTAGYVFFADASGSASGSANLFWDITNNRLGIGTASPLARLHVLQTDTGTGLLNGITQSLTSTPSALKSSATYGASFTTIIAGTNANTNARAFFASTAVTGTSTGNQVAGFSARVNMVTAGQALDASAGDFIFSHESSGTVTNPYGLRILNFQNLGVMTNPIGLWIGDVTVGIQTNPAYSIYSSDANARNYFAGNTGVNVLAPAATFDVGGTARIGTLTGTATQMVGATAGNILTTYSTGYGLTFASGALRADTASANGLVTQSDLATGLASAADGNGIIEALPVGNVTINSANTLTIGSATIFSQINRSNFYVENASGDFGQLLPQLLRVYDADNDEEVEIRERSIVHTENSGQPMTISTTNELDVIAAQNVNISAGAGSYDLNITAANVQVSGDISAQNINAGSGLDVTGTATFRGAAEAEGSAVLYEAIANGINTHTLLAPASIPSNIRTRLPASAPTTESGVWERDASENSIFRAMVHSDVAGSTDGSGDITVSHDNDDGTFNVQVTVTGTTFFHAQVHTKTASDFKIRFFDAAGAPVTGTAVTADYTLTDK